jgi:oligopeptide transport system substrate-binding protein
MKYLSFIIVVFLFLQNCGDSQEKTKVSLSKTESPIVNELRWSNGKKPKSFDPARAFASPETDVVRAIFKGLTDIDPQTLQLIPAIASSWESSEDYRVWTFYLRKDAKWTNGETITAKDFVRSWQRLVSLSNSVSHKRLFKNISGMDTEKVLPVFASEEDAETEENRESRENNKESSVEEKLLLDENTSKDVLSRKDSQQETASNPQKEGKNLFGVEALDDWTLRVSLIHSDPDFPALVAHTVFYPVYQGGKEFKENDLTTKITTNGAFRLVSVQENEIILQKNPLYWNSSEVTLEKIRIIHFENAEEALQAYKDGQIDVLTNANFTPTALKLLASFDDFSQVVHGAVNLYQFNQSNPPFNDRRVREALAIAIERDKIVEDEGGGFVKPASSYLPFAKPAIKEDVKRARELLSEAGFPDGENFPTVRLLINRNDMQKRVARKIAKMWEKNLNIKTQIIVKEGKELEVAVRNSDFDIVRRGVVLPTTSETANMMLLFPRNETFPVTIQEIMEEAIEGESEQLLDKKLENWLTATEGKTITSEEKALQELPAIPIYFSTAYSLVKPYVKNFILNSLDIPSLEKVQIDKSQ